MHLNSKVEPIPDGQKTSVMWEYHLLPLWEGGWQMICRFVRVVNVRGIKHDPPHNGKVKWLCYVLHYFIKMNWQRLTHSIQWCPRVQESTKCTLSCKCHYDWWSTKCPQCKKLFCWCSHWWSVDSKAKNLCSAKSVLKENCKSIGN